MPHALTESHKEAIAAKQDSERRCAALVVGCGIAAALLSATVAAWLIVPLLHFV